MNLSFPELQNEVDEIFKPIAEVIQWMDIIDNTVVNPLSQWRQIGRMTYRIRSDSEGRKWRVKVWLL